MTAGELHAWLRALHVVPEPSVDRIVVGAPETVVRGIAIVWMPTWRVLRAAAAQGLNVVIAHEPTFFNHHELGGLGGAGVDLPPHAAAIAGTASGAKRQWIEERGMVVIRCHDVLDAMPGGVVDTLAGQLGFSRADYVSEANPYRIVRLALACRAIEVGERLSRAFVSLGQPGVAFYGDPERCVQTLGLGTGYGCEPWRLVELGADMALTINDRIKTWVEGEWAEDSGYPLVVVDHGTSEEWGVRRLAERVREGFRAIPVHTVEQGFSARWIAGHA